MNLNTKVNIEKLNKNNNLRTVSHVTSCFFIAKKRSGIYEQKEICYN